MSIVTGWRAKLAIIDGAQVMMSRKPGSMLWPAFWYEVLDDAHGVALQEDTDRAWVARELGDVPYRGRSYEETMQLAFASTVPVESLGRDDG